MFYEEKLVHGVLYCRSKPNGEWRLVKTPLAAVVNALAAMKDEQRLEAMGFFCPRCGCVQPEGRPCQCWNDE